MVALGSATADGRLIHGRNLDWTDYGGRLTGTLVVLDCAPTDGMRTVLLVWPGMIGSLTGTNEKGLTVAFNQLGVSTGTGEPLFLLLRRVLDESEGLDGALALLEQAPVTADGAIVLSDARGDDAACVEWFEGVARVRRPEEGILVADNGRHAGEGARPQTSMALWQLARERAGRLTSDEVCRMLGHERVLLPWNLYSCVLVPEAGELHLAVGRVPAATTCRYEPVRLFAEPSAVAATGR